jgi:GNAT superfamily N-acetyltransferase
MESSMATEPYPLVDLGLARRLEKAEAKSNARFVVARAELFPESGAQWIEVAGAYAMFDTVSSPLTQSFGLGVFGEVTHDDLARLEEFFRERGAYVFHEISPLAPPGMLGLLKDRGYHPIELTSVMYRPICREESLEGRRQEHLLARPAGRGEHARCADLSVRGWHEHPELRDFLGDVGAVTAIWEGVRSFIAELRGQPIATGILSLCDGIALLAGASTVPEARNQGAQVALLESRLRYGAGQGCDLAMMCAAPGSASQRNAERNGFRIAYTRIKWQLS